jgi:benzoyl-CoA 2,3-epoxidase subunit B
MSTINYSEKIPNNVNLSEDRTLQRALEQWQPNYLQWWGDMGPDGSQDFDVYLRTATSVDPQGWAQFGYVKMPDYRWGIFLNPAEQNRKIHFGDHKGEDGLAGRARRVSRQPAPHHRHAGRYRAGERRAAAPPRPDRA